MNLRGLQNFWGRPYPGKPPAPIEIIFKLRLIFFWGVPPSAEWSPAFAGGVTLISIQHLEVANLGTGITIFSWNYGEEMRDSDPRGGCQHLTLFDMFHLSIHLHTTES